MNEEYRDRMFGILLEMSDRQVDEQAKKYIRNLLGKPNSEVKGLLLNLLDLIVHHSWTSDFEIQVLHRIWLSIGGTEEELRARNPVMNEDCHE